MNWKHVSLGEISVNIQTGPFGSQLHQSDYSEKGTPVVMPKDLSSANTFKSNKRQMGSLYLGNLISARLILICYGVSSPRQRKRT